MEWLADAAAQEARLQGVVVTKLPDCLAFESWSRGAWDTDAVAAYFGDLTVANRRAIEALSDESQPDTAAAVTIETAQHIILTQELRSDFVAVYVFDQAVSLGMARVQAKRISASILGHLPSEVLFQRTRGERVMEFLLRYAPDPHAVPMRIALQTGIPIENLERAALLDATQVELVEAAARDILGVSSLSV